MFDSLIGNEHVKDALRRMIKAGRLPHSLLLAGPEGLGKKQFALEIARSLVCQCKNGDGGCGTCAVCRRSVTFSIPKPEKKDDFKKVFFSQHTDVGMVVAFNRNILVDAIRDLESEANFMPYEAPARVFIIDDADRLNDNSSNALLKTLEEPPATSYIFLVTCRPDRLLSTIRSRCQLVRFSGIARADIERYLVDTKGFSPGDAVVAAAVCKGSIGTAMGLDVNAFRASRELMLGILEGAIKHRELGSLMQVADQISDAKNKGRFEESLEILETLIRDLLVLRTGARVLVNQDLARVLKGLSETASVHDLSAWILAIETISENLKVNIHRRAAADALFVGMAG